ncbi:MAG: hypothetical protein AAGH65_05780, partial [Pseudomonadota bacterium]
MESKLNEGFVKAMAPAGWVAYWPKWLDAEPATNLYDRLLDDVNWESRTIRIFGREVLQPRLISFQGEADVHYRYSGGDYLAQAWHPEVQRLQRRLTEWLQQRRAELPALPTTAFNSVLINRYRDGRDS